MMNQQVNKVDLLSNLKESINSKLSINLIDKKNNLGKLPKMPVEGKLVRMVGLTLETVGVHAAIGAVCHVETSDGQFIETEVVGFSGEKLFLMPTAEVHGLLPNARVIPAGQKYQIPVGDDLLGRVIDGSGIPLDGLDPIKSKETVGLQGKSMNPLLRKPIRESLDVGVRAINTLLTIGQGQRIGLFAGSGVGKSVLLGMMTKFTTADVVVVGLIGERGREVKEFVQEILGEKGLKKAVVIAAPADSSALKRLHGAMLANSIAEHFRDKGKNVLLLIDSLTRFAQAQREISLAIGEPPATKGYPPSVFAQLPKLVERAGNGENGKGSITAFYTVLVEGDDHNDPIADSARAILDGHIVLSRDIADSGLYPAINVESSISRVMPNVVSEEWQKRAQLFKALYSSYEKNKDLISVGAYQKGSDPAIDQAIAFNPKLCQFLSQGMNEKVDFETSKRDLENLFAPNENATVEPQTIAQTISN